MNRRILLLLLQLEIEAEINIEAAKQTAIEIFLRITFPFLKPFY